MENAATFSFKISTKFKGDLNNTNQCSFCKEPQRGPDASKCGDNGLSLQL